MHWKAIIRAFRLRSILSYDTWILWSDMWLVLPWMILLAFLKVKATKSTTETGRYSSDSSPSPNANAFSLVNSQLYFPRQTSFCDSATQFQRMSIRFMRVWACELKVSFVQEGHTGVHVERNFPCILFPAVTQPFIAILSLFAQAATSVNCNIF